MHKKLASDLISLAHSILQMKTKDDVFALKEKAHEVYEKLSLLAYVEEYINTTPNATSTKEEILLTIKEIESKTQVFIDEEKIEETITNSLENEDEEELQMSNAADDFADAVIDKIEEEKVENFIEQPFDALEKLFNANDNVKDDARDIGDRKSLTLEDELKDTISVDSMVDLFEKVEPKSLNDKLQNNIQIGLNDRIAFVKHLFNGDQGDYNRVVSQLNTFKTEKEAKKFINKTVKPDYNWDEKEEYETRFFEIIERRFT